MKNKLLQLMMTAIILMAGHRGYTQQWTPVGSVAFSPGQANLTSMAMGKNDTPYVAYLDQAHGDAVSVMKYNGSAWVNVGPPGFSNTTIAWDGNYAANSLILKIDTSGKPYVLFMDSVKPPFSLMTYDGTNWVYIDSPGIVTGESQAAVLSMDLDPSGDPYIAFQDWNHSYKASVMKHTTGGGWALVGAQKFTPGSADYISLAVDNTGTPWLAFGDGSVNGNISVQKFNGSSWILQGAEGFSYGQYGVRTTSMTFDNNNTAYVAYQDGGHDYEASVKKFAGGSWVAVGDTDFSLSQADCINIMVSAGGVPVVSFSDMNSLYKASVKDFDGTAWVDLGTPDFSGGQANWVSLALSKTGVPYVAFEDYVNGHTASVYSFGIPAGISTVADVSSTVNIYPNPNKGSFTVKVNTQQAGEMSLSLYDLVGRQVWNSGTIEINGTYSAAVNAGKLSTGSYILQARTNSGVNTQKIEIVR